jgi:hypothetical protein
VETSGGGSGNFQKTGCTISLMAAVQTGALAPGPDQQQQQQHILLYFISFYIIILQKILTNNHVSFITVE